MGRFDISGELSLRQVVAWPIEGQAPRLVGRDRQQAPCGAGRCARCEAQLETIVDLLETLLESVAQEGPSRVHASLEAHDAGDNYELTPREKEVLAELVEGRSNRQIAEALTVSVATIKSHVSNILAKMGAESRTEAATMALQQQVE